MPHQRNDPHPAVADAGKHAASNRMIFIAGPSEEYREDACSMGLK
jgi:hypothetical protein